MQHTNPLTGARQGQNRSNRGSNQGRSYSRPALNTRQAPAESMSNPALRDALENLKKKAVESGVFKGAVLYPQVPALDRRVPAWQREENDDLVNLSTDTNSFIGRTIGFSKGAQFKCIATGLRISSLAGYWRFLISGQRHTPLLNDRTDVPFKEVAYVRHLYAFLAMGIWSKVTSNEDLRTVMSSKLPRFDFFFFASADQRDRARTTQSAIIIDMYARINHALATGRLPEFYRWFDVDVQDELRQKANEITNLEEREAFYAQVLAETYGVSKARNEARRADRRQKLEEEKKAKQEIVKGETAPTPAEPETPAAEQPDLSLEPTHVEPPAAETPAQEQESEGQVIVLNGLAPASNSLSM